MPHMDGFPWWGSTKQQTPAHPEIHTKLDKMQADIEKMKSTLSQILESLEHAARQDHNKRASRSRYVKRNDKDEESESDQSDQSDQYGPISDDEDGKKSRGRSPPRHYRHK